MNTVNSDRPSTQKLRVATVRECIRIDLLENLIMTTEIPNVNDITQLTDVQVETWYKSVLDDHPTDLAQQVNQILRRHTMQPNTKDPEAGVQAYVHEVMTSLRRVGGSKFFQDKNQAKTVISKMIHGLKPNEVRDLTFKDRQMWKEAECASVGHFLQRASVFARQVQEVFNVSSNRGKYNPDRSPPLKNRTGKKRELDDQQDDEISNDKKDGGKHNDAEWKYDCLHPNCHEKHRIRDCPIASEKEKKELLEAHRAKHRPRGGKRQRRTLKSITGVDPSNYNINIEIGNCRAKARDDTGSDITVIPRSLANQILKEDITLSEDHLIEPITAELAVQGKKIPTVIVNSQIRTSIIIRLPGSCLPVLLRNVKLRITDFSMNVVLLGRDVLDKLGFNFANYLKKNYNDINNCDLDEAKPKLAAYQGVRYGDDKDDPVPPPVDLSEQFGNDVEADVEKALEERILEATKNGLSKKGTDRLRAILKSRISVFGIKLGSHPPAKIKPFEVKIKPDAKPIRASPRRYGPIQQQFIEETIRNLEKIGAVYRNPNARWASPALAVPKPGTDQLRFTVDLRTVNMLTQAIQNSLPHLESLLQECAGSKCFANIDFCHGFWQIPLAKISQEIMSIVTTIGIFSPTRTLQGGTDSGSYFHDTTREKFIGKIKKLIQWLDDYLLHEADEDKLLDNLDIFFSVCQEFGFRIHAKKSSFFMKEAKFCGRILSEDGIKFDPRNLRTILDMKQPTTGDELQQLLCAANWMRTSIPCFTKLIAPLHDALETACSRTTKRTKKALSKISLKDMWTDKQDIAFGELKEALANSISLAYPKNDHTICLFTDASEDYWSGILCQSETSSMNVDVTERNYEPLGFLSGAFRNSACNWSIPEKEGYAILESMMRFDYITMGRIVHIFTDHANLLNMYDPGRCSGNLPQYAVNKLLRWAIKLSQFRYVIEHIPGESNVWADLLSRWANGHKVKVCSLRNKISAVQYAPISPSLSEEMSWPTSDEIRKIQPTTSPGNAWKRVNQEWRNAKGEVYIPNSDTLMIQRLLVAAHAGIAGHRGRQTTRNNLTGNFWWSTIDQDVKSFVASCLHCLASASGDMVPRPLGHSIHATEVNEIIHFDYCFMGPSTADHQYVLIIKDDLTSYTWFKPASRLDAITTANLLIEWFSAFGIAKTWISDRGSHFLNETIHELNETLKSEHHFTLPYCPWSNGTVEVVCRELKKVMKSILNEFKLPTKMWLSVLPLVQSALNNSTQKRLNDKCPLELFTGHKRDTPVGAIMVPEGTSNVVHNLSLERQKALLKLEKLNSALNEMHRETAQSTGRRRKQAVRSHNQKTGIRPINFTVGDFVLRGNTKKGKKLQLVWNGPFQVVECMSDYLFKIKDLVRGDLHTVHGRRLKFFRNSDFKVTQDVCHHLDYQNGELLVIETIEDIRLIDGLVECRVKWKGFETIENDWLPIDILKEDVPELFNEFLVDMSTTGTKRQRELAKSLL